MVKVVKFKLKNFKGIEEAEINFSKRHETPVVTLIGLNESGKTTLLEGLSHFVTGDPIIAKIFDSNNITSEALSLIPIHKKANFTGNISIAAELLLEPEDINKIIELSQNKFKKIIDKSKLEKPITIERVYAFKDGNLILKGKKNLTDIEILVKSNKNAKEFKRYKIPEDADADNLFDDIWYFILDRIPSVSYFPTFLVEMPAKIYLSEHPDENATNRHYRAVLQDVLDSLNEGLSLEKHVAERIRDYREKAENPLWLSMILSSPIKGQINSVFQKISNAISKEIIGSWNKVFHRPISAKNITVDWFIDPAKDNLPYAEITLSDGESPYALHERSLGFRWFFSFLLFTRFKQSKNKPTLFLFDEPAANLHARAQNELLDSFIKILEGGHKIVYSTHSHHMINPRWLSGAYIIENEAIDYDSDDDVAGLSSLPTNISAKPYRRFVSEYPDRISYYQPVIEKLDYVTPQLIPSKPVVITEGISDFHAFSSVIKNKKLKFELMPGIGAGDNDPLISLLISKGQDFIILLDDDDEGKKQKKRYQNKWYLDDTTILTLRDLDISYSGKKLETLLSTKTHKIINSHFSSKGNKASKKRIALFFAEKNIETSNKPTISSETSNVFENILNELNKKF